MGSTVEDANIGLLAHKKAMINMTEELVLKEIPRKILQLERLCAKKPFQLGSELKYDINLPVPKAPKIETMPAKRPKKEKKGDDEVVLFPNGTVPCNPHITAMVNTIKPTLDEFLDDVKRIRMWINLLIPQEADGNNFGVEIQELVLQQVHNLEEESKASFGKIIVYFKERGELVSKIAKYPHAEDFRVALQVKDENMARFCYFVLTEVKNGYVALHDLVLKNLNRIKNPRSENNEHFY